MRIKTNNLVRNLMIVLAFFVVFVALAYGMETQNRDDKQQEPKNTPNFRLSMLFDRPTSTPTAASTQEIPTEVSTPAPTTSLPPVTIVIPPPSGAGGAGGACSIPLEVVVFIDYNRDGFGVTNEMVMGLQIHLYDSSYNRLGTAYTNNGKASFCLPRKGVYYLDMPYIQTTKEFRNDGVSDNNLITVIIDPPDIPVRLP